MAVVAPMPRARVRTAMVVNVGVRRRTRAPYLRSCRKSVYRALRLVVLALRLATLSTSTLMWSRSPSLTRAAALASSSLIPRAT